LYVRVAPPTAIVRPVPVLAVVAVPQPALRTAPPLLLVLLPLLLVLLPLLLVLLPLLLVLPLLLLVLLPLLLVLLPLLLVLLPPLPPDDVFTNTVAEAVFEGSARLAATT
jgi:hypothetical protein